MNMLDKMVQDLLNQEAIFRGTTIDKSFPKYRITQTDEYKFKLELALAGYNKDYIKVSSIKNKISIKYEAPKETTEKSEKYPIVIENLIAERDFEKVWTTNDQYIIDVKKVSMDDGILSIEIEIVVPDDWKEKTYKVK